MDDILASASKENLELLDQPSLEDNHHIGKPTVIPALLPANPTLMVLLTLSTLLHWMTSHLTEGPVYLTDTRRTWIHTPQHLNPYPTEGNRPPQNPMIPEAKLIPLLMLQTDTTMVTKMTTPNWAAQTNPEDPAALMDQEDQVASADPVALVVLEVHADWATTLPTSSTSCRNL